MSDPERWTIWTDSEQDDTTVYVRVMGEPICVQPWHDEGMQRARLIAAAPDLLAALEDAVIECESLANSGTVEDIDALRHKVAQYAGVIRRARPAAKEGGE